MDAESRLGQAAGCPLICWSNAVLMRFDNTMPKVEFREKADRDVEDVVVRASGPS